MRHWLRGLKLKTKVSAIVGMTLVFALGSTTVMMVSTSTADLRAALHGKALVLGQGMAQEMGRVLDLGIPLEELTDLSQQCREIVQAHDNLDFVLVLDPDNVILYHNDETMVGSTESSVAAEGFNPGSGVRHYATSAGGAKSYNTLVPVRDTEGDYRASIILGFGGAVISAKVARLVRDSVIIGLISFIASLLLIMFFFTGQIVRPLSSLMESARAAAGGDLTREVSISSGDEIGELSTAFGEMLKSLRDLQGRVATAFEEMESAISAITEHSLILQMGTDRQSSAASQISDFITHMNEQSTRVTDSMESLSQKSGETSSSIMEMMASIKAVAQSIESLSSFVNDSSASMEQVLVTNREAAENVGKLTNLIAGALTEVREIGEGAKQIEELSQDSRQLAETVKADAEVEGASAMENAMSLMNRIRDSIVKLSDTATTLTASVENIGSIIDVIDDITDQTNLLSLNAAVIAAEAGEHGRGFAVVADEIRKLAESTSASTREISMVIGGIQEETGAVASLVGKSVGHVDEGVEVMKKAGEALKKITVSSGRAVDMSGRITAVTSEQSAGSQNVGRSIQHVSDFARDISAALTDLSQRSDGVIRSIDELRALSDKVRQETADQTVGARFIAKSGETTNQLAQELTNSVQEGKSISDQAVREVNSILESTQGTQEIVHNLNELVGKFVSLSNDLKSALATFRT